jgi:hypothetical protein
VYNDARDEALACLLRAQRASGQVDAALIAARLHDQQQLAGLCGLGGVLLLQLLQLLLLLVCSQASQALSPAGRAAADERQRLSAGIVSTRAGAITHRST